MTDDTLESGFAAAIVEELGATSRDISQMRGLVSDAVLKLGDGFERIVGESRAQQTLIEELLTQVSDGDRRDGRVTQFIAQSERLLGDVGTGLEKSSDRVLKLAARLDEIDHTFRKLVNLTETVNDVSKEIRVLAFNAHLEATRAGQGGKGFSVVANAVRELSESFRSLTEQIQDVVGEARESISETVAATRAAAVADQSTVLRSRQEMARLHGAVETLSREMTKSLQDARQMAQEIRVGVNQCVKGLQFDDLIGQLCEGTERRLMSCRAVAEAHIDDTARCAAGAAVAAPECAQPSTPRQHQVVQQTSLDAGDIEFF